MISLAGEYLAHGAETEACAAYRETIDYSLYVWGILSPLPKKIAALSRNSEKANESHYYSVEKLTGMLFDNPKQYGFYFDMFRTPFEKIKRASETYRAQYIRLATAASSEEGMTFATTMAKMMKEMYYSYTLIYEVLNLSLMTSKFAYVTMFNSMPKIIIEALSTELTPKDIKELRAYVKKLEKLCRENDWMKFLRIEIPTEELLTSEPAPATTADEPIEELEAPAEEAPIEEVPTEDAPIEEAPTEEAPVEESAEEGTACVEVSEETREQAAEETAEEASTEETGDEASEEASPEVTEEPTTEETTAEETTTEATEQTATEDALSDVL